jgi:metal-sulfur cluster biosynthetic enzyme
LLAQEKIKEALADVLVPGIQRSLIDLNLVQNIEFAGDKVKITLASTALDEDAQRWVKEKAASVVKQTSKNTEIEVVFIEKRPI